MSSSNLIRWSGLATLVGGVLWIAENVADFILIGDQPDSTAATTNAWVIVSGLALLGVVFILLGLVGLYARQAEQAGTLGPVAFLVAFTGTTMLFGFAWGGVFIVPFFAETAPDALDMPPAGVLVVGMMLTFVLFALGWLLFGLASLRARVLPRGAAMLLMIGAALFFIVALLELPFFAVVFGAAQVWMGYGLWSGTDEPALTAEPATQAG